MAVHDLFSKRQKRMRGEMPDVYVYDEIPRPLRVQLVQIICCGMGKPGFPLVSQIYSELREILCREYGVFSLGEIWTDFDRDSAHILDHILNTANAEQVIDVVELCLKIIDTRVRENIVFCLPQTHPDDTISETNVRFKEHGVGYEYVSGEMVRIDSQLLHQDVVKPTLKFLADPQFAGANDEFLKAHEHYRHGRYKECLNDCLKAFESTMKSICDQKGWAYDAQRSTAKQLIEICMSNGLFPTFMQNHITNLRSILESGLPTVRNKQGGHGQGATVVDVTQATASFALHSAATNILFFVESARNLP